MQRAITMLSFMSMYFIHVSVSAPIRININTHASIELPRDTIIPTSLQKLYGQQHEKISNSNSAP